TVCCPDPPPLPARPVPPGQERLRDPAMASRGRADAARAGHRRHELAGRERRPSRLRPRGELVRLQVRLSREDTPETPPAARLLAGAEPASGLRSEREREHALEKGQQLFCATLD